MVPKMTTVDTAMAVLCPSHFTTGSAPNTAAARVPEVRSLPPPQRVQQHCFRVEAEEAARCHHREEGKASPAHGGHDGL